MELSQEQQAAAYTDSKSALCLAGAGSGKTRVLTARIKHLIEEKQVSPYEFMVCTFTRKAAGEMRERLENLIGNQAHSLTIGTIHSVALNFIQRFGEFIGMNPGRITVYSQWEEGILLKDVCKELGYHDGKKWRLPKDVKKKDIDQAFHLFYTRKKKDERAYIPNDILDAFFVRCRENNALTYGMIMTSFLELIPRIAKMLRFKHILIDEIQDNDNIQWRIANLICSICDASLFVVGDDSQSIYSFRGADPGYLIRNQDKFDIYKLRDNYRSNRYIVEASNKLIKHNQNRLDLEMNAKRGWQEEVENLQNANSTKLVEVVKLFDRFYGENLAVIGRNHFLLEKLSTLLSESEIDHEYVGKKTAFTRSEEFRRVHAFLTLAVNPFDNFSFLLVKEYLEIDIGGYKDIRMKAVQEDKSHFQVWKESYDGMPGWKKSYVKQIVDESFDGILEWLNVVDFDFDLKPVIHFIRDYLSCTHNPRIHDYLEWLALYDVQDEMVSEPKKLQLMTIHASKGLEFDMVIIAGLNEGILPSYRARNNQDELESERRLAYVAYTRAKNHLVLTSRPVDPEAKLQQPPSRFIKESL